MSDDAIYELVDELEKLKFTEMRGIENPAKVNRNVGRSKFCASGVGYRRKYGNGDVRVTVGTKTTCIYEVDGKAAVRLESYPTREIESIIDDVERRLGL